FRGGVAIYVVYLVALAARLALDSLFLGPAAFDAGTTVALSGAPLLSTMATDLLLTFGVGLLLGRAVRLAKRYAKIAAGVEIPASQLPAQK
ncbi:MAG: hypothetical protein JRN51_10700, partial [Nitrososphaerota archaeon]|nr:hypothetical protein [Nitrososphaerota archaeon]